MTASIRLENLTRPFAKNVQEGLAIPSGRVKTAADASENVERALLEFGNGGASIFQGFTGGIAGGKADRNFREVSRSTTRVRVENPDDPEQFVNVDRINSIQFQDKAGLISQFDLAWDK